MNSDVVSFNGTITTNNSVAEEYGNRDFRSNIYPIDNTPPVPSQGIQVKKKKKDTLILVSKQTFYLGSSLRPWGSLWY